MRVLVAHNRYRIEGGEERSVELQLQALRRVDVPHALLERSSAEVSRPRAALALLRGGFDEEDVAAAASELGADVVHVHNMLPLLGPRALEAARASGAAVILHLHNLRLFCAIGVAARDGGPCFRCHHRNTLPGLVLNCRESVPEAMAYAIALARHQPAVFDSVDRFVVPSEYAAGQSARLGVPAERIDVLPHYLPEVAFAVRSRAAEGEYALVAARLAPEKGIDTAVRAAALADIPLRVAGEGPAEAELVELANLVGGRVDFLGRLGRERLERELAGAAMVLMPSRYHEFAPYSALEAMAAGVPVMASSLGGLPELIGEERCVPPNDPHALAARMRNLWREPDRRRVEGDALIERARARHSEQLYTERLLDLYARAATGGDRAPQPLDGVGEPRR
jgi:glycosyltransferase involved in cell wall biosynthesis